MGSLQRLDSDPGEHEERKSDDRQDHDAPTAQGGPESGVQEHCEDQPHAQGTERPWGRSSSVGWPSLVPDIVRFTLRTMPMSNPKVSRGKATVMAPRLTARFARGWAGQGRTAVTVSI